MGRSGSLMNELLLASSTCKHKSYVRGAPRIQAKFLSASSIIAVHMVSLTNAEQLLIMAVSFNPLQLKAMEKPHCVKDRLKAIIAGLFCSEMTRSNESGPCDPAIAGGGPFGALSFGSMKAERR